VKRLVVLISGRGSNLAALIDDCQNGALDATISLVISDRAQAPGLQLAQKRGIATKVISPSKFDSKKAWNQAMFDCLHAAAADLIILAGFMRILNADAVEPFSGRMLNIHPSLLPKYQGLNTHARALAAQDPVHGASVHFVTQQLDGGPVLMQAQMTVLPGDTVHSLAARLLPLEHALICQAVRLVISGRVSIQQNCLSVDGIALAQPLQLGEKS
jgi:phosphoribosylglycinamide formyltransferase 1